MCLPTRASPVDIAIREKCPSGTHVRLELSVLEKTWAHYSLLIILLIYLLYRSSHLSKTLPYSRKLCVVLGGVFSHQNMALTSVLLMDKKAANATYGTIRLEGNVPDLPNRMQER